MSLSKSHWAVFLIILLVSLQFISILLDGRKLDPRKLRGVLFCRKKHDNESSVVAVGKAVANNQTSLRLSENKKNETIKVNTDAPHLEARGALPVIEETNNNVPLVVKPRAFDSWPEHRALPCFQAEANWTSQKVLNKRTTTGFLFLKLFKTGSSSACGVNIRIATNVARRLVKDFPHCQARFDHAWASNLFPHRDKHKSYLWTIVRDPTKRIVSQFFHFEVSRNKIEPTDQNFISNVRQNAAAGRFSMTRDYYLNALSLKEFDSNKDDALAFANQIVQDYDFMGITERMDESLVVMTMLLRVPISDVLYLMAKGHGGYDDGGGRDDKICTFIWPSFVSTGMREFLDSDEWTKMSYWDRMIYQAANQSLDLTIERLGREKVAQKLALYQQAKEHGHKKCLAKTTFPCSVGGKYTPKDQTDCVFLDSACGLDCLDEVATELEIA